jgi:hypothetical protein
MFSAEWWRDNWEKVLGIVGGLWDDTLGGYQVLKKWLSYRERPILGRPLTVDEAAHVTAVARRIAALLLLGPELDANYRRTKAEPYAWPG